MKIYFLNHADDRFGYKGGQFLRNQKVLNESARRQGLTNIVSWTYPTLAKTNFYKENKEYLDKNRFDNGAVWKPYIVQHQLNEINNGDIIFYYDCGPYTVPHRVDLLVKMCINNEGTLFHEWGGKNSMYTKRDAFVYMDCDTPRFHNHTHLQNTWFLIQKNAFTEQFVAEWLHYNLDERIASYDQPNTCGLPNIEGYVQNRGDQSIFSNLAIKHGLKTFTGAGGTPNREVANFMETYSLKLRLKKRLINSIKSILPEIRCPKQ